MIVMHCSLNEAHPQNPGMNYFINFYIFSVVIFKIKILMSDKN